jgi:hypothetical protein
VPIPSRFGFVRGDWPLKTCPREFAIRLHLIRGLRREASHACFKEYRLQLSRLVVPNLKRVEVENTRHVHIVEQTQ